MFPSQADGRQSWRSRSKQAIRAEGALGSEGRVEGWLRSMAGGLITREDVNKEREIRTDKAGYLDGRQE